MYTAWGLTEAVQTSLHATEMWAHTLPVERLAMASHTQRLASGAHREVYVWELADNTTDSTDPQWTNRINVANLYQLEAVDAPVVTGLHWTNLQRHADVLLVAYLNEGIRRVLDDLVWNM